MNQKALLTTTLVLLSLAAARALAYTVEQAAMGKDLYATHCAVCHGPDGRGGTVPKQFGEHAGMQAEALTGPEGLHGMKNAGEVYTFSKTTMPLHQPGSLKDSDYLAIVAFALQGIGVEPDGRPLSAASAADVKLEKK
ncbi:MAG: cytochrome c [bacterium]